MIEILVVAVVAGAGLMVIIFGPRGEERRLRKASRRVIRQNAQERMLQVTRRIEGQHWREKGE